MGSRRLAKYLWILFFVLILPANVLAADQTNSGQQKAAGKVCTTQAEAAKAMRAYLVKREEEFAIPVKLKIKNVSGAEEREAALDEVMDKIRDLALAETNKPYEGDYLNQLKGYNSNANGTWKGEYFEGDFIYYCPLFSTADQEKKVDAAVTKILKKLALDGKSEYEKIRAIYDYICTHSTYDYTVDSDLPYTAYSILVRGKGACEGYAKAVYRLMREAGIGCRVIEADSKKGDAGHAWNIVRIGKLWYYVDTTWDTANYEEKKPYHQYFLKGSKDKSYVDHGEFTVKYSKTEQNFWKNHPLSASDYSYEDPVTPESEKKNDSEVFNYRSSPQNLKVKAGKKRTAVLTWKKTPGASGYQIRYSLKKNMKSSKTVTIKKGSTLKKVIKNLKKKKYYFQIRAFRVLPNSTKYSVWSSKVARRIK